MQQLESQSNIPKRPEAGISNPRGSDCCSRFSGFYNGDCQMKKIPLTQGKFAIVDNEDYEKVNRHKWYAAKGRNTFYAKRSKAHKKVRMHREILQPADSLVTDHINHNGLDNRRSNLRAVTHAQNQWNPLRKPKGVSWQKQCKRWHAQIQHNGTKIYLGVYKTKKEAKLAYLEAKLKFRGVYAD